MPADQQTLETETTSTPTRYIEREGERQLQRVVEALETEPLGLAFLQLAWTAGPVTFIALQGGYFFGYGKSAPTPLFMYFAAYTLITGIVGVIASVSYKLITGRKKRQTEKSLLFTIAQLPDLLSGARNFRMQLLSTQDRAYEAARYVLWNSHPPPLALRHAVHTITDDLDLGIAIEQIEIYRRLGLHAHAHDYVSLARQMLKQHDESLAQSHPEIAALLQDRINGFAPTLKTGVTREDGFIERIFLAIETNNLSYMTLKDAEEMLVLFMELLNGREIEILHFRYVGNRSLREAAEMLEQSRSAFRTSQAIMSHRIEHLTDMLTDANVIEWQEEDTIESIYKQSFYWLDHMAKKILSVSYIGELKMIDNHLLKTWRRGIGLYRFIEDAYQNVLKKHSKYLRAIERWQSHSDKVSNKKTAFRYGRGRTGLRIVEKVIALNDAQKLQAASDFSQILSSDFKKLYLEQRYTEKSIKRLAIEITLIIQPLINLSKPTIVYGIESANAANMSTMEQGISVQAKTGWAHAIVREVEKNKAKSAERLANVLVNQYNEELDEDAIAFLHDSYGANKNILYAIQQNRLQSTSSTRYVKRLDQSIEPLPQRWLKALQMLSKTTLG